MKPRVWARFHAVATVVWLVLIVPSILWWRDSVAWVVLMSAWANVAAHWASYQAARADERIRRSSR